MHIFFIFSTLFFIINVGFAQELNGRILDNQIGLHSKECYGLVINKQNELIVSTLYGTYKYNGNEFTKICLNIPTKESSFYELLKLSDGNVYGWNSSNKIYKIENQIAILIYDLNEINNKNRQVTLGIEECKNGLQIIKSHSTFFLDVKKKKLTKIKVHEDEIIVSKKDTISIKTKQIDFKKNIYSRPNPQLKSLGDRKKVIELSEKYRKVQVCKLRNSYYLLHNNQLFLFDKKRIIDSKISDANKILVINGLLYVGTQNGLLVINEKNQILGVYYRNIQINNLIFDQNYGLFISTAENYIIHIRNLREINIKILPSDLIFSDKNSLFLRRKNKEVYEISKDKLTTKNIRLTSLFSKYEGILNIKKNNNYWLIHDVHGTSIINENGRVILSKIPLHLLHVIKYDSMYILFNRHHINKISTVKHDLKLRYVADLEFYRNSISVDSENNLLIVENNCISLFNLKKNEKTIIHSQLHSSLPTFVYRHDKQKILIGTRFGGLHITDIHSVTKINTPFNNVEQICSNSKFYFFRTNNGIYQIQKNKLLEKNIEWKKVFNSEVENIVANEANLFLKIQDNITIIDIEKKQCNSLFFNVDAIVSDDVKQMRNKRSIKIEKKIVLSFNLSDINANSVQLGYEIEGMSKVKNSISSSTIEIDGLPDGKYKLTVYPIVDDSNIKSKKIDFHLYVTTPFWKKTGFHIFVLILIVFLFLKIFLQKMKIKKAIEKDELSLQKISLLSQRFKAIKAQVNPHFLSNGLSSIQLLILKNEGEKGAYYLSQFSLLMRLILNQSESNFVTLKEELELIKLYLKLEQLRFKTKIDVNINVEVKDLNYSDIYLPSLMLQPIIENAIWHGLSELHDKQPVLSILFRVSDNNLVITISDNGCGIKKTEKNIGHFSLGSKLIAERITLLNDIMKKKVATLVIDSSESGTNVTFILSNELFLNKNSNERFYY